MKVIQQDWSKIRNQLWNKKQGSNKAKRSEIDIWLKLGKMHRTNTIFFFKQEICNFICIFIFRCNNYICSFIFSNKAWQQYDHDKSYLLFIAVENVAHRN